MEKPGPRRAACNIQTSSTEQMQAGKEEEEEKSQERLHTSSTGEMQKEEEGKRRASHEGSFCNILNWVNSEYLLAWEAVKKRIFYGQAGQKGWVTHPPPTLQSAFRDFLVYIQP